MLLAEPVDETVQPKSVPCFESCGAMWVEASQLWDLSTEDFRSRDTRDIYSAVEDGSLQPQPINTGAFRALERMVKKFTQQPHEGNFNRWIQDVNAVWKLLRDEYPLTNFKAE